jgi:DNA polymerase-1
MKTILVIDGNSILNRAFFGIRAMTTSKDGRFTNAIYGLVNILHRELTALQPDYAAIAFDLRAPTFRHKMYEPYKANRHGMPEELRSQLDDAKLCVELMGLHRLELEGYEADDILGTVSAMTKEDPDLHAYVLSGDRDLLQLISPQVSVLLAGNAETACMDRDAFFAKYGVEPEQFVDVKALMGDSSDNIPGVAGVGEKTAFRLIAEHGSLDAVYEQLDAPDITKGLRAKLEAGRDMAYTSKTLVTILRDAPIGKTLADLTYRGMNRPALREKFVDLEFSALIRRFGLDREEEPTTAEAEAEAKEATGISYRPAGANEVLAAAGTDAPIALCLQADTLYINIKEENLAFTGDITALSPLLDGSHTLLVYDGKALFHALRARGVTLGGTPEDIMLYAYAVDAAGGAPLPHALATVYLGMTPAEGEPYAHLLPALREALAARVEEVGATALLHEIELPLAMLLAKVEATGFKIDRAGLDRFREQLEAAMKTLTQNIYHLAGEEFNINSPKQLGHILFEKLGLPAEKKTKSGYSTDVEVLSHLRRIHPIVGEILDYRQIAKLYATYAVGLLRVADEADRIHTDFKQALTATGRLSSAEPNLQNIPIRTELGREMRRYFIPENESYVLVDADYSQIELRLLAHMAGDENMIAAFHSGMDIHTATAAAVFDLPIEDVTDELRKRAKAVNFGIVYGIGAFSLAGDLGISTGAAKEYIDSYFATYPGVAAYMDKTVAKAYEDGYVTTLYGRRRTVPELHVQNKVTRKFGERVAMNSPIQGTAADIIKIAMLRVDRRLQQEGIDARLVMQVHDELILEAERSVAEQAAAILREEMENAANLAVPLTVDVVISDTWLE